MKRLFLILALCFATIANAAYLNNTVAQGSTTSGQNGALVQGATTTAAPTQTTGTTNPVSLTTSGAVRTDKTSIAGTTTSVSNGTTDAGTQRVTISSDSTGQVKLATGANTIGALTANQSTNIAQMNGVATTMGNGVSGTGVQRVTIASDSTGVVSLAAGANTIGSLAANQSINNAQVSGTAIDVNSGVKSAGTMRVVIATDQPALTNKLLVTPDSVALPANQSTNESQINGITPLMGNGVTGTGSQRVTIASDNTAFSVNSVQSGTWNIGSITTLPALPANQSTNEAQINGVAPLMGNGVTGTGSQRVTIASDNTAFSVNAAQSGTWNVTNVSGTVSLPTGAATAAKQPALGTAGTSSADVLTVQGRASMTPLLVDATATTQPTNVTQFSGNAATTGEGSSGAGVLRVTMAQDSRAIQPLTFTQGGPYSSLNVSINTGGGSSAAVDTQGYAYVSFVVPVTSTVTSGVISFEASADNTNFIAVPLYDASTPTSIPVTSYSPSTGTNKSFFGPIPFQYFRIRISSALTGGGGVGCFGQYTRTPTNVIGASGATTSSNVAQLAGTTTDTNSGNKSAGTLRVVLATDQPQLTNKLLVTPDSVALPANQSVNISQIAGTTTSVNVGAADAGTIRVAPNNESWQDLYFTGAAAQTAVVNNIIPSSSGATATDVTGYKSGSVQVTSTGTGGTFIFEGSNDNVNFQTIPVYGQLILTGTPITAAVTASATQLIYTFPIQTRYVRLRIASTITGGSIQAFSCFKQSAWTPGVFQVAQATTANLQTTSTIASGTVTTVSTVTNVGTIGTSVTPGTAAANLGKAEDAASASGDTGVFALGIRRDTVGTNTSANGDYSEIATSTYGALLTAPFEVSAPSYICAYGGGTLAVGATDVLTITGSATKIVYVTRIEITTYSATAFEGIITIAKLSTADTGGTSSTGTAIPRDSNDAAATAVVTNYTANPTSGTRVGNFAVYNSRWDNTQYLPNVVWDYSDHNKPIVLRGTSQQIAINLSGNTFAGAQLFVTFYWYEL